MELPDLTAFDPGAVLDTDTLCRISEDPGSLDLDFESDPLLTSDRENTDLLPEDFGLSDAPLMDQISAEELGALIEEAPTFEQEMSPIDFDTGTEEFTAPQATAADAMLANMMQITYEMQSLTGTPLAAYCRGEDQSRVFSEEAGTEDQCRHTTTPLTERAGDNAGDAWMFIGSPGIDADPEVQGATCVYIQVQGLPTEDGAINRGILGRSCIKPEPSEHCMGATFNAIDGRNDHHIRLSVGGLMDRWYEYVQDTGTTFSSIRALDRLPETVNLAYMFSEPGEFSTSCLYAGDVVLKGCSFGAPLTNFMRDFATGELLRGDNGEPVFGPSDEVQCTGAATASAPTDAPADDVTPEPPTDDLGAPAAPTQDDAP